jgi:hypothetical protein
MTTLRSLQHDADRLQQRHSWLAFPLAACRKIADDQAGNLAALIAYYAFPGMTTARSMASWRAEGRSRSERRATKGGPRDRGSWHTASGQPAARTAQLRAGSAARHGDREPDARLLLPAGGDLG